MRYTTVGQQISSRRDPHKGAATGRQVAAVPTDYYHKFDTMHRGYDASVSETILAEGGAPSMIDFDVDYKNRLVQLNGIETIIDTGADVPDGIFAHPSLDGEVQVVFMSGNKLGVKVGNVVNWYATGVTAGKGWVHAMYGDQLILANGRADIFYRDFNVNTLNGLGWGSAKTLIQFAGRLFAGNANIGGTDNPLGIKWTGAGGLSDIASLTSGFELLLDDTTENDQIVALRSIGFDLMVIVLRKSIWIGQRTGDPFRPVDFRPRVPGIGAVSEPTVRTTVGGVMFLSDRGVKFFNGQNVEHMSRAIDNDLLPLDYEKLDEYNAVYDPQRQVYQLSTPRGTWLYSFIDQRWVRSSASFYRAISLYNPRATTSAAVSAGWGVYWGGFWGSTPAPGGVEEDDMLFVKGSLIGKPNEALNTYFGVPQEATWTSPRLELKSIADVATYKRIDIEYEGNAEVAIYTRDVNGNFETFIQTTLANTVVTRPQMLHGFRSGLGVQFQFKILSGRVKIARFGILAQHRGLRQA